MRIKCYPRVPCTSAPYLKPTAKDTFFTHIFPSNHDHAGRLALLRPDVVREVLVVVADHIARLPVLA